MSKTQCRSEARRRAQGLDCPICGRGPCRDDALATLPPIPTEVVPNRLHGVAINTKGEAI